MAFTSEWRTANNALLETFTARRNTSAHEQKQRHKKWKQRCWAQHGTRTGCRFNRHILKRVEKLRVEGERIAQQWLPPQTLMNHLVKCLYHYGCDDDHGLVHAAIAPFIRTSTQLCYPDALLYYGSQANMDAAFAVFEHVLYNVRVQDVWPTQVELSRMYCDKGASCTMRAYLDPHGVPPVGVRHFVHFMLLVCERLDIVPPEIWLVIMSFCRLADLCFRFVPRAAAPCAHCGKAALWRCRRCKRARYCDAACQQAHYSTHKHVCCRPYFPSTQFY